MSEPTRSGNGRGGFRPGAGRPRKDADGAILAATRRLLSTGGFQRLSIGAVAEEANVSPGTVYRRWPNKSALALAAYGETIGSASPPDTGSLRGDLAAMAPEIHDFFTGEHGRVLASLLTEGGAYAEIGPSVRRSTGSRRMGIKKVLQRAIDRGEVRTSLDVDLVLDMMLGPLWTRLLVSNQPVTQRMVRTLLDLVADAVCAG